MTWKLNLSMQLKMAFAFFAITSHILTKRTSDLLQHKAISHIPKMLSRTEDFVAFHPPSHTLFLMALYIWGP